MSHLRKNILQTNLFATLTAYFVIRDLKDTH